MPSNVFLNYDDELVKRLYDAAVKKAGIMADDISRNIKKVRNDRFLPYLFRWLMVPADWISFKMVPFDFTVSRACNKCMQCIRLCPRKNISFRGKIRHGLRCEACCRCIYGCPQKAISWRLGNFAVLKNGYNIRERINKVKDIKVTSPLKGIYRTLKSYLNE
jgi:ferredoxin